MKIQVGKLKSLINEASQSYQNVTLSDGTTCDYGSPEHLADMEKLIGGLECLRNQHRRTSAARSIYASALRHLKSEIKKVQRKIPVDSEIEEPTASIEEPGKPRKPKPGFGGGLASSPAHGRHSPGE